MLHLGNLNSRRGWGYAPEYVVAMWKMLQAEKPHDYVLATGKTCSIREFTSAAFLALGMELVFEGEGVDEVGRCSSTGQLVIKIDPRYFRLVDSSDLVGDASLAGRILNWTPKVVGVDVARLMAVADHEQLQGNAIQSP